VRLQGIGEGLELVDGLVFPPTVEDGQEDAISETIVVVELLECPPLSRTTSLPCFYTRLGKEVVFHEKFSQQRA